MDSYTCILCQSDLTRQVRYGYQDKQLCPECRTWTLEAAKALLSSLPLALASLLGAYSNPRKQRDSEEKQAEK